MWSLGGRVCGAWGSRCVQSCSDGKVPLPTLPASVRGETRVVLCGWGGGTLRDIWCLLNACLVSGSSELGRLCKRSREVETVPQGPGEGSAQDTHSYSRRRDLHTQTSV